MTEPKTQTKRATAQGPMLDLYVYPIRLGGISGKSLYLRLVAKPAKTGDHSAPNSRPGRRPGTEATRPQKVVNGWRSRQRSSVSPVSARSSPPTLEEFIR